MKQRKAGNILPLVLLATASLLVSLWTVKDLDWEAHISIMQGFILFFSGLVFFPSIYLATNALFLHTVFGRRLVKTYKLNTGDVFDISNKQVSAVQALFCGLTGFTSCRYSCKRDMLRTSHYISEAYAWFGAAYFFYDIWSMYKVYSAKVSAGYMNGDAKAGKVGRGHKLVGYLRNNAVIVGHHLFIGGFGFLVITYLRGGLGDCFFGFVYLMEASTPFVSLRGILSKMGMKESRLYVVNGLLMLVSFFVCRVAMFPYVIHMYAQAIGKDFISAVFTLPRGCLVSIAFLLLPQIYWFVLMLNGATKVLRKSVSNNNNLNSINAK
ncbi:hypothetical protein NQ315_000297 [Exocentrus adspersus]|uniref:TLC domain-containing protein n=1 Tax=Exocentrus adspersus TaxID=1586481 RepID=A0AAV8VQN1_9CUCU|nr:hypothetical protein NQ315_000297 [Exocentrus adspersus]